MAQDPVEVSSRGYAWERRCISDIIRDVLGLNKNGPELCNWITLDVRASFWFMGDVLVILLHI